MNTGRRLLGGTWLILVSGCMTTGALHHSGAAPDVADGQGWHRVEAHSGGLAIEMVFPSPGGRAVVPVEARLWAEAEGRELTDGEVWLRVQTPTGRVDRVRMRNVPSRDGDWYEAQYGFRTTGSYMLSADASVSTGESVHEVSVTTRLQVDEELHGGYGHGWVMPLAVLGGVAMLTMMAVMMSS